MLTIMEHSKLNLSDVYAQGVVQVYAQNSDILRVLPFKNIDGNAYKYVQEDTLPGIAFRGINEAFDEGTGVMNPQVEALIIAGGDLDVDTFLIRTQSSNGTDVRTQHESMKVKALAQLWTQKFIKGDSVTDPREFDGIQRRVGTTGTQTVNNGGAALSLAKLDELLDTVDDVNYLYMNKAMKRRITQASRNQAVGGAVNFDLDAFGRVIETYAGHPILISDRNGQEFSSLGFDEVGSTTSIYALEVGEGKLMGIQNGAMDIRDLGEMKEKPVERTRIEWFNSLLLEHPRAVGRLHNVLDGAVVV